MSYTFYGLVLRDGPTLSYDANVSQPLTTYMNTTVYVTVNTGTQTLQVDINKILTRIPGVDTSKNYDDVVSALDALTLLNYHDATIPQRDATTNMFLDRIVEIDPYMEDDYTVSYTSIYYPSVVDDLYRRGMCDDLRITVPVGKDPSTLIPFVNGVFHQTVIQDQYLYALDGFANMRIAQKKNLVLLDTSAVGGHTFIPFTQDMIVSDQSLLQNGVLIKSPQDLTDVSVFVVIDGYLFFEQDYVRKASSSVVRINTNVMDFPSMFVKHPLTKTKADTFGDKTVWTNPYYQDIDPVPVITNPQTDYPSKANDSYLGTFVTQPVQPVANFTSNAFILSRLLLPNSGLLLINSKDLFRLEFPLTPDDSEREYFAYNKNESARGILKYDIGFVLPYNVLYAPDGYHRVFIQDPMEYEDLTQYTHCGYITKLPLEPTQNPIMRKAKLTDFYSV